MIVGDWGMPMPFNELLTGGPDDVYEKRAIDHSFVGLDSSYIYATRPNGDGRETCFAIFPYSSDFIKIPSFHPYNYS